MDTLMTAISTVGFPIVAFLLMYKMVNGCIRDNTEAIKENTKLMTEVLTLVESVRKLREREIDGK